MSAAGSELLRLPLCCDRLAPGHARDAVKCLDAVGPVREEAVLVVSELVSTAVIERGCESPEETLELVASELPTGLHLEVDSEADRRPAFGTISKRVLSALTSRWGVDADKGRARLWAEIAV